MKKNETFDSVGATAFKIEKIVFGSTLIIFQISRDIQKRVNHMYLRFVLVHIHNYIIYQFYVN